MPSIRAFCESCDRYVRGVKEKNTTHVLHVLLSVCTCGLWLPIWLLVGVSDASQPYRCPYCGSRVHRD